MGCRWRKARGRGALAPCGSSRRTTAARRSYGCSVRARPAPSRWSSPAVTFRFYCGGQPVFDSTTRTVSAASLSAGIITLTTSAVHGWSTGDCIMLNMSALGPDVAGRLPWPGVAAHVHADDHDDDAQERRPIAPDPSDLDRQRSRRRDGHADQGHFRALHQRLRQDQGGAGAEQRDHPAPELDALQGHGDGAGGRRGPGLFTFAAITFIDGPYLDPQGGPTSPEGGTVSGYSGSVNFHAGHDGPRRAPTSAG
jgi:hypothetical protein